MRKLRLTLLAAALVAAGGLYANAAGFFTNGVPPAGGSQYPSTIPLTGNETVPADTNLASGQNPASEAITTGQLQTYVQGWYATTVPSSSTVTVNAATARLFGITLTGPTTIGTPTNLQPGQNIIYQLQQDSTGSRTVTWAALFKWTNGSAPTLTTNPSAVDLIKCDYSTVATTANTVDLFCSSVLNLK